MFVPCPHCGFLVALSAGGEADRQPCPRCGGALEDDAAGAAPVADAATSKQPVPPAAAVKSPATKSPAGRGARVATPAFARRRAPDGGRRGQAWSWLAVAVLGVLLALQLFLAQRAQLAADAGTRPFATAVCSVLGCTVPPWREPSAWTMLSRDVAPSASEAGVLEVTAAFRNQARWPQPLPVLTLSLTDRHGRVVAARAFTPEEYQSSGVPSVVASGEAAQVHLRVREPDTDIVAFSFEFR